MKKLFCIFLMAFGATALFLGFAPKAEAASPIITNEYLPSATEGQPYLYELKATGGTKPYTWATPYPLSPPSACGPKAPSGASGLDNTYGLYLTTDGKIKADKIIIPENAVTPITHEFYIGLEDAGKNCSVPAAVKFSIEIKSASPGPAIGIPVIQTTEVPPGQINKEYKPRGKIFQFEALGGCNPSAGYQWQKTAKSELPAGLMWEQQGALEWGDGKITGTPTEIVKEKEFSVRAKDECGSISDFQKFTITIYPEIPLSIITQSLPQKGTNQTYQATLQAEGGLPPYEWEILFTDREGNLFEKPARWLTLFVPSGNAETASLGGITPSKQGDYQFSAFVTDVNYNYFMKEFLISVGKEGPAGGGKVIRDNSKCPTTGLVPCGTEGCPCEFCDFFVMTNNIIKEIFKFIPIIAAMMLIIGGVLFFFAGAKADTVNQAKGIITSVVIGLLIIFSAWVIVNTVFDKSGIIKTEGWRWYEVGCAEN